MRYFLEQSKGAPKSLTLLGRLHLADFNNRTLLRHHVVPPRVSFEKPLGTAFAHTHTYLAEGTSLVARSRVNLLPRRQAHALEGGARGAATNVRHNRQFEYGHIRQIDTVDFNLPNRRRRTEIPLLAHNFAKPLLASRKPSQYKLLCSCCLVFLENQYDSFDPLWLIEQQPNRLRACFSSTPALRLGEHQSCLDREILVVRSYLNHSCVLQI
jgi:hypothetical protein